MKQPNLVKTITDLGLSENEAKVYLAALALGSTTVLQISRKASVKRTTVYPVLESLKTKGLITSQAYGFKKRYVAEDPEKLKEILNAKRNNLQESLPLLASIQKLTTTEGISKFYEGLPAIKTLYDSVLSTLEENDDYLIIGNHEIWYNLDPVYFRSFMERRSQIALAKNIETKLLLQDSELSRIRKEKDNYPDETIKIIPKNITIDTNLVITPRQLIIHQMKGKEVAIVIENPYIIETHRQIFNVLWEMS